MKMTDSLQNIEWVRIEYLPETGKASIECKIKTYAGLEAMLCAYLIDSFMAKAITLRRLVYLIISSKIEAKRELRREENKKMNEKEFG